MGNVERERVDEDCHERQMKGSNSIYNLQINVHTHLYGYVVIQDFNSNYLMLLYVDILSVY